MRLVVYKKQKVSDRHDNKWIPWQSCWVVGKESFHLPSIPSLSHLPFPVSSILHCFVYLHPVPVLNLCSTFWNQVITVKEEAN